MEDKIKKVFNEMTHRSIAELFQTLSTDSILCYDSHKYLCFRYCDTAGLYKSMNLQEFSDINFVFHIINLLYNQVLKPVKKNLALKD